MDRESFAYEDLPGSETDPPFDSSAAAFRDIRRRAVVAIPVKDEQQRLPACLKALAAQRDRWGRALDPRCFGVVVFANNCCDESARLAEALGGRLSLPLRVVEAELPPADAHAGNARRAAMDLAEAWLGEERANDGVILTTDADSRVSELWLASNLAEIDAGADAVLGSIELDEEGDLLPPMLHRRGELEGVYEGLLTELAALLDPLEHNPWPHHATISGASIAIRREAYLAVGGLPRVSLGEDKALVAELMRRDRKLRFSPEVRVTTSGRVNGRAPGGVAETLRVRSHDPLALCDEALEPFGVALERARWRGRLRRAYRAGEPAAAEVCLRELAIPATEGKRCFRSLAFGEAWRAIERRSPVLTRRRLTPSELPEEIARARRALAKLRKDALAAREDVEPEMGEMLASLDAR